MQAPWKHKSLVWIEWSRYWLAIQCSKQCNRHVYIEGVTAENGGELAGISSNYKDTATLTNDCANGKTKC